MEQGFERDDFLRSDLFAKITKPQADKMLKCSMAAYKNYQSGELIFGQNDKPKNLYLLLKGQVIITKYFPSGRRDILFHVRENQVFGEIFLFANEEYYWYDALAVKDCQVLVLPYGFIYGMCPNVCDHHKQIIQNLLDIQSKKNLQMSKKLHILTSATLKQKLILLLLDEQDENHEVHLDMTREELADYLGVARPSLSRTLKELEQAGIIENKRKIIRLKNLEKIEEIFEE